MNIKLQRANHKVAFRLSNADANELLVDASPAVGGERLGMRPMELLLSALVSCASIDVILILKKMKVELEHYEVLVEGLRPDKSPAPFSQINLEFIISQNDPIDSVSKAVYLGVEKYCSVGLSLHPDIRVEYKISVKQ